LFKSKSSAGDKTNLFVFITPHVVKHPSEAEEIYQQKKDQIEQIQEGNIKMYDKKSP
jgi:general secretion pathway protein D